MNLEKRMLAKIARPFGWAIGGILATVSSPLLIPLAVKYYNTYPDQTSRGQNTYESLSSAIDASFHDGDKLRRFLLFPVEGVHRAGLYFSKFSPNGS